MKSVIQSTAELARVCGLSRWTVSRALNGHPGLDARTVARVRETARRHGFSPNLLGRGLRSGQTNLVGVCLPDIETYFLTVKIRRLQEALAARGWHPLLQIVDGSEESENAALERFAAMRCAGVVAIASRLTENAPGRRSLAAAGIGVVHIDPLLSGTGTAVLTDRNFAMRQAIEHLHELGHRRLVAAGFGAGNFYARQRIRGLRAGCRAHGWDFSRDVCLLKLTAPLADFSAGAALAPACLAGMRRGYSAILAVNDRVALGILRTLEQAGAKIPRDVSLVGYDNADFGLHLSPPLTTIDPQVDELIERAAEMLVKGRLDGASLLVKPRLVPRASTAPLSPARRSRQRRRPVQPKDSAHR